MDFMRELEEELRLGGFRVWLVLVSVIGVGGVGLFLHYFIQELFPKRSKPKDKQ